MVIYTEDRIGSPNAARVIVELDQLLDHPEWPIRKQAILERYNL